MSANTPQTLITHEHRLISYGTLAPGRSNHRQMDGMVGRWFKGTIRGRLSKQGEGQWRGYPAFRLDPNGDPIEVFVFESLDLPGHLARLDAFEGPRYERVVTDVETSEGVMRAFIYEVKAS